MVLKELKPGEAVVIIDYKMKIELGMHLREIQWDWYGKRGISLYGFFVVVQTSEQQRKIEVLDLWSDDTKKDAWFTQSVLDIGFKWMPNFNVYLFSGKLRVYAKTLFKLVELIEVKTIMKNLMLKSKLLLLLQQGEILWGQRKSVFLCSC